MADLDIQAARRSFGSFTALDDVDLEVADGELCVIVGPSGCGKSTLLRAVAGLENLDAGTIHIGGEEVTRLAPKDRDIAFVFQSYALYPHLTVRRNLEFPLRMRGVDSTERERRVVEAAELLGIAELLERKPAELSGGQRQRVAMGRAMVRRPKLFLFDEPLSNLDAQLRGRMRVELVELHRQLGWTALYVTHDQAEAMTLGEKVVVMKGGRIRQIGPPRELYDRPVDVFVAGFVGNPPMNFFRGEVRDAGGERRFETPGWSVAAPQELKPGPTVLGVRPEDLEVVDSGLEARVRLVEDLGADRFVVAGAGETNVLYRAAESSPLPRTGDLVQLSLRSGKEHWFQDDRRVRREAS